ncbi:hypothetical protein Mapa_004332 [Marchantia paleacea]|nr:hypothetical protein Mapa_004332 [Marchantia paleacea]
MVHDPSGSPYLDRWFGANLLNGVISTCTNIMCITHAILKPVSRSARARLCSIDFPGDLKLKPPKFYRGPFNGE